MSGLYDEVLVALHGIWRRRWLALAVGWAIAMLGWFVIGLIPNTYKSEAHVQVESQSLLNDKIGINPADRARSIDAVRQSLTSTANLEQIVRGTDLAKRVKSDRDVASKVTALQRSITIVAQGDNLFQLGATASEAGLSDRQNAQLAHAIVQKLIDQFVAGNRRDANQETGQSLQFLDTEIAKRGAALAEAEGKRAAFEAKYLSGLPGTGSVGDRVATARGELVRVESDLAAAQSALAAVNGQMAATPAETRTAGVVVPGTAAQGSSRVATIEGQIAEGQARGWTENYPDMVVLRGQLSRARSQGGGSTGTASRMAAGTSAPNPMYVSLRSMQAERQAAAGALAARKGQIEGEINRVLTLQSSSPQFASELSSVDGNYQAMKAQYDKLVADREDLRLRGQVQSQTSAVKITTIDGPTLPSGPATPNRPVLLTLVLIAAIGGGLGAAFGMGQVRTTYPTAARLEKASGLPVIGSISQVVRAPERQVQRQRLMQFAGGAAALVGFWVVLIAWDFIQRGLAA